MAGYYLVELACGPAWDHSRPRRRQAGWDEHAAFMDALTEEGVVVLGGPVGEGDGKGVLLVADVESAAAIRARLADDPWASDMLTIESVEPWSVWLRATEGQAP
ncbi:MAG: YciI family protein [Gaiellaceae bacterium]